MSGNDNRDFLSKCDTMPSRRIAVVDTEVGVRNKRVHDIGAWRYDNAIFHGASVAALSDFLRPVEYVCGHNIIDHDIKYLFGADALLGWELVDTLYLSPLLFPRQPYHRLVKDGKLVSEDANNPVNDSYKARDLLFDEIAAWHSLTQRQKAIYSGLLCGRVHFAGFLKLVGAHSHEENIAELIRSEYRGRICENADIEVLIEKYSCELAYALALIGTGDVGSITPGWVLHNFPNIEYVISVLRNRHCEAGCAYCSSKLNATAGLNRFFGYSQFRTYEGEPLQELAVEAALAEKSLLAIFPTGGGKSLTFQLPALMQGEAVHGLTVVISPLQSLMKDQVDALVARGITYAETINGMLDPISRALAIERVANGEASLLYISPEMLRSNTVERILLKRHIVRFVVDEAHCFSSWGQDFRVDYLYIGEFIRNYMAAKGLHHAIPISCFTATAKQKVVQDICDYFNRTLNVELELFTTTATRTNLRYSVIHVESDTEKYLKLRSLLASAAGPAIVYVSRTRRTVDLADKLTRDGYPAKPFNGKMDADQKIANQEAFMNGKVGIIVATSAFGMGVDKSDVAMVVHYDISDSLENYVQEAGRAGRDPNLSARCYVLYNDSDLDKHFILLNQTKLNFCEIQQIWKAIKDLTKRRPTVRCSALELARQAGWDDSVSDVETRVRTAVAALEQSGYVQRGNNMPHVYATGICVRNVDEARNRITNSKLFEEAEIDKAVRVIKSLISQKYVKMAQNVDAESRVDYLADILGISRGDVISAVERMRIEGILADRMDLTAYLQNGADMERRLSARIENLAKLETFILNSIPPTGLRISYKQLNDNAIKAGVVYSKEKDIRTLLYFLTIKGYVTKTESKGCLVLGLQDSPERIMSRVALRIDLCRMAIRYLSQLAANNEESVLSSPDAPQTDDRPLAFSVVDMLERFKPQVNNILSNGRALELDDIKEALLYLSKVDALKLDGGFLVVYNAMDIKRIKDSKLRYRQADYRLLDEFYKLKMQQIHIVGEYANMMVRDYDAALQFVKDYFCMDYKKFVAKYFVGERWQEIQRNLTPQKYQEVFGELSPRQAEIIRDHESRCIVVAAGPGSGKTRVLVHKLASLLMLEDVKHEQLLMLTFSRSAATEFKQRLIGLIGNAANFAEIKTFHSFCFDLMGRVGNIADAQDVVKQATDMIIRREVEPNRISKSVLVIDEAQDMGKDEYELVKALIDSNETLRVIAVGDDDQCIYEFRGSDFSYMYGLANEPFSRVIEMTENFRSHRHIVDFANEFSKRISRRLKSKPITSKSASDGRVELTRHQSPNMYVPLAEQLRQVRDGGSVCVLTQTNEDAALMVALLRNAGIESELIQTLGGLRFCDIVEVKFFMNYIKRQLTGPTIPDQLWHQAVEATLKAYDRSINMQYVKRCFKNFESTNRVKYFSDLQEFVFESSIEDFYDPDSAKVIVSTIHKAKGREFDDVFMYVADRPELYNSDAHKRVLYVGMTRARNRLFIHTNSDAFSHCPVDKYSTDSTQYDIPTEIELNLSHKDVYLDFFKDIKSDVLALQAGDALMFKDMTLYTTDGRPVARLSLSMQAEVNDWTARQYLVREASVRFIVAWKPKDAPKDAKAYAILLPKLRLCRKLT